MPIATGRTHRGPTPSPRFGAIPPPWTTSDARPKPTRRGPPVLIALCRRSRRRHASNVGPPAGRTGRSPGSAPQRAASPPDPHRPRSESMTAPSEPPAADAGDRGDAPPRRGAPPSGRARAVLGASRLAVATLASAVLGAGALAAILFAAGAIHGDSTADA